MKIKNLNAANDALHRLAEIDLELAGHQAARDDIILQAKHNCETECAPLDAERAKIFEALHAYTDEHRDEIIPDGKKSVDLANGTLGYRACPDSIEVSADTAQLLIDAGFAHCVKIKKEPVKAALKGFADDDLSKVQAKRIPGQENFYADANEIRTSTPNRAA